jgi:hypothetical protein
MSPQPPSLLIHQHQLFSATSSFHHIKHPPQASLHHYQAFTTTEPSPQTSLHHNKLSPHKASTTMNFYYVIIWLLSMITATADYTMGSTYTTDTLSAVCTFSLINVNLVTTKHVTVMAGNYKALSARHTTPPFPAPHSSPATTSTKALRRSRSQSSMSPSGRRERISKNP